ncbi:hypothetical protein [Sphingomonas solaris]|uniref:Uncharacterized protein n=1 Tax=Alterirhizorhabdus solaris TaxID=2529389 RepID=A0A558R844_9SPHN|nr:hypothetical protein [Sphingomonas solaris]TVV75565.1 hypothetical protein FOY91_06810 [Sphingomonas solaris]
MSDFQDQQLSVEIVDGRLLISIGTGLLVHAVTNGSDFWDEVELVVTDPEAFAAAIAAELEHEEEDGTTPVHRMLDKAAERAVENGCDGVDETPADEREDG